jgi:hypothetical protein
MHPNTADPLYIPCSEIIFAYEDCNSVTWKRYLNQCQSLYEKMSLCMKQQRLKKRDDNHSKMKDRNRKFDELSKELELNWFK